MNIKFTDKKIIIAAIVLILVLILAIVGWFVFRRSSSFWFGGEVIPVTENYDIQKDYCGKGVDIRYCNCAFQGEDCEIVGIPNKDTAKDLVTAGFESWALEKKKEECSQKGGEWVKEKCRK